MVSCGRYHHSAAAAVLSYRPDRRTTHAGAWTESNIHNHMVFRIALTSIVATSRNSSVDFSVLIGYDWDDIALGHENIRAAFMREARSVTEGSPVSVYMRPLYGTTGRIVTLWNILGEWGYDIGTYMSAVLAPRTYDGTSRGILVK